MSTKNKLKFIRIANPSIKILLLIVIIFVCTECTKIQKTSKAIFECRSERYCGDTLKIMGMKVDSLKEGLWISLFADGAIHDVTVFMNGKEHGPSIVYGKNGKVKFYREYKDGIFHGKGYIFHKNGVLKEEMSFYEDKLNGLLKEYNSCGDLVGIHEYNNHKYVRTLSGKVPDFILYPEFNIAYDEQ